MKKLIIAFIFSLICIIASSQEFVAPSKQKSVYTDTTTTYTYKCPDMTYKVYKSKSGAFYIWKKSKKTNKEYKAYLPKEIQKQMGRKYNEE